MAYTNAVIGVVAGLIIPGFLIVVIFILYTFKKELKLDLLIKRCCCKETHLMVKKRQATENPYILDNRGFLGRHPAVLTDDVELATHADMAILRQSIRESRLRNASNADSAPADRATVTNADTNVNHSEVMFTNSCPELPSRVVNRQRLQNYENYGGSPNPTDGVVLRDKPARNIDFTPVEIEYENVISHESCVAIKLPMRSTYLDESSDDSSDDDDNPRLGEQVKLPQRSAKTNLDVQKEIINCSIHEDLDKEVENSDQQPECLMLDGFTGSMDIRSDETTDSMHGNLDQISDEVPDFSTSQNFKAHSENVYEEAIEYCDNDDDDNDDDGEDSEGADVITSATYASNLLHGYHNNQKPTAPKRHTCIGISTPEPEYGNLYENHVTRRLQTVSQIYENVAPDSPFNYATSGTGHYASHIPVNSLGWDNYNNNNNNSNRFMSSISLPSGEGSSSSAKMEKRTRNSVL